MIIAISNSTISLQNSIFTDISFNDAMIDISFFQKVNIENIWFINNTFSYCGIKIHSGNASMVIINSLNFKNMNLDDFFLVFHSLDSTLTINNLEILTFSFEKSNKTIF